MLYYERNFKKKGYRLIIGVDEAGRGPLAGPVVAAAVALKTARFKNRIDDSKKLTPSAREKAFLEIIHKSVFGIGIINEKIIDSINILEATRLAMEVAISALIKKIKSQKKKFIHILVDGNVKLNIDFSYTNIIRGDAKSKSIASASILAKVTRDRIMSIYDRIYPEYGFLQHKGYPTKIHRQALKRLGPSLIHRMSFSGV
ncbi:MAG: ribonuclease HII [Omnitrophica WOR_2 bacterium RIFCSPLOWO2_01_FULL_41_12]|nr:MAG: ribonuclease HII [Omnitrophica WOR_2 bacterium RIFCSPLOWO2_01_FULL_41_12]